MVEKLVGLVVLCMTYVKKRVRKQYSCADKCVFAMKQYRHWSLQIRRGVECWSFNSRPLMYLYASPFLDSMRFLEKNQVLKFTIRNAVLKTATMLQLNWIVFNHRTPSCRRV
jgi:hypothetical protein